MVIFHSYVSLPEGIPLNKQWLVGATYPSEKWWTTRQLGWCSIPNIYMVPVIIIIHSYPFHGSSHHQPESNFCGFLVVDPHCTWCFIPGTSPAIHFRENSEICSANWELEIFQSKFSQFFGQFDDGNPRISHKVHWNGVMCWNGASQFFWFTIGNLPRINDIRKFTGDLLVRLKRREFSGMIHWRTINHNPSNPQQPIQQPDVKRTSQFCRAWESHEIPW